MEFDLVSQHFPGFNYSERSHVTAPCLQFNVSTLDVWRVHQMLINYVDAKHSLIYGQLPFRNMRLSGNRWTKAPRPIDIIFCTFDYIGEITKCAKMVRLGWRGAARSPERLNIRWFHFSKLNHIFLCCRTIPTRIRPLQASWLEQRSLAQGCAFWSRVRFYQTSFRGHKSPKTLIFSLQMLFYSKIKYTLSNLRTVGDRRKSSQRQLVTSFPISNAPYRPKAMFCY